MGKSNKNLGLMRLISDKVVDPHIPLRVQLRHNCEVPTKNHNEIMPLQIKEGGVKYHTPGKNEIFADKQPFCAPL